MITEWSLGECPAKRSNGAPPGCVTLTEITERITHAGQELLAAAG
jgi:hypothetical protein